MAEVAQPLAHMLFPLDRMPVLHRTNTSGLFRTKLTSTFLVCWRKNTQAQREQAYSAQKGPQATIRFKEESIEMMRGACYQQTQIFRAWFCRDKNEIDIKWLSTSECNYYLVSIFYVHNTSIYTMIAKQFELIWDGSAADRERDVQPKVKAGPWKQHGAREEWSWGGWVLFLSCWDLATVLVRISFSNKQLHEEITADYVQISK